MSTLYLPICDVCAERGMPMNAATSDKADTWFHASREGWTRKEDVLGQGLIYRCPDCSEKVAKK